MPESAYKYKIKRKPIKIVIFSLFLIVGGGYLVKKVHLPSILSNDTIKVYTDSSSKKITTESMVSSANQSGGITAQTASIIIGGIGGSAPGAGGGVLESLNSVTKDRNTIILKGTDGAAPGAGGGGAGALGKGGVGGGGGEGGKMVQVSLLEDSCDSIGYTIVKGGESGKNGGDTVIKCIKDGKVVKVVTAKGGKAGAPGKNGDL